MEGLAPPLKCLVEIQSALQNGETVRTGITLYLSRADRRDAFAAELRRFIFAWDQGHDWRSTAQRINSPYRRALLELIGSSLAGQPVLSHLEELRVEIERACELEINRNLEILPIKMLIPLLLFQFPAFLLLLFGPLLKKLLEELSR